jgi:hypothetical protein
MLWASVSSAQSTDPARIIVSYAEVTEGQNEISQLGLYFNFADQSGRPIVSSGSSSGSGRATIVVSGSGQNLTQEARIEAPNTPLYVVMVLDASGSMQAAAQDMRRAAIEAVNALPDGTQFSIIVFNRQVSTGTPFTRTKNEVINLIGTYQPARPSDPNAGTCLFDAAYAAIEKALEAPLPARRTVLLFTDGRDELTAGRGDTCSTRTLNDVIAKSTDVSNPVSVNTVGLRGAVAIDEAGLRGMAESSKGFAAIGSLNELPNLFKVIVDALNNQRVARADFCLPRGQYTATLLTQAGFNGPQLSDTFNFTTDLQCTPATATPAARPIVRVTTKDFNRDAQEVTIQIGGENLEQITRYRVFINDPTGASIGEYQLDGGGAPDPITFSMIGRPDGRVRIDIVAVRFNGETIEADDELIVSRPTPTPSPSPTHTPSPTPPPTLVPVGVNVESIIYDTATDTIKISIVYTQAEQVARVRIDIIDNRGFNKASQDRTELIESVEFVASDIGLIADQAYTLRVEAFNTERRSLNRVETRFTYDPPRTPTPAPTSTNTPTPTPTPLVFTADIDAIGYDAENDLLQIRLTLENNDQMGDIELLVLDANNVLIDTIVVDPVSPISYPGAKLIPQARYTFRLKATDRSGRVVANSEFQNFAYPRVVTPTPTSTHTPTNTPPPTNTPTPTPILTALELVALDYRVSDKVLNIQFTGSNLDQIARYRVVLNDGGGVIIDQREFDATVTEFDLPLDLTTGDFQVIVTALDANGQSLTAFDRSFKLNVPTPTPTPPPSFFERVQENPLIAVMILIIILALIGLLVFLIMGGRRERTRNQTSVSSLPSMTGAFVISKPEDTEPKQLGGPSSTPTKPAGSAVSSATVSLDEPTMRPGTLDAEKTNALIGGFADADKTNAAILTTGFLKVRESGDANIVGKTLMLSNPFYIGRTGPRTNNLNVDGDKNVSRKHAELRLEGSDWVIEDNGSALGTSVNGTTISGPTTLNEGDEIRLGGTTTLIFTRKG